eukprot:CAMPEP_0119557398 /NCGR_PEP_ID=MMETSP1352-20130426/9080_1 /TAXON_ID=265584 /ORGANISM="Stauroneis constricta, Strain CCMP1120" /LENGTH=195 /DNA_ID=CAMNT_0007604499 /DNA_START=147 /DNA_END=734 /DNA_ORIENTATION=-
MMMMMLPTLAEEPVNRKLSPHTKSSRHVTFNLIPTIHPIHHINDLSDDDIHNMWLSCDEMLHIKKNYTAIVRLMMNQREQFVDDWKNGICSRGLECRTRDASKRRKRNKAAAIHAVLDEQDIQYDDGICDPQFISDVYRAVTSPVRQAALARGLQDEIEMIQTLPKHTRTARMQKLAKMRKLDTPTYPKRRTSLE